MAERKDRITLFASIGSVISGIAASLCCMGPLVFVFLGLGGAAFFTKIEQYRLIFVAVSIGFLSLGFFSAYRGGEECSPNRGCTISPKRRKLNRIILWIAAVLVFAFLISPSIIGLFTN